MNNLIVNADDFGANSSINNAIITLFDQGIINSATLMANMPGFEEAIDLTHSHKITNKIGAHLVLTAGKPLTNEISSISHLFNSENNSRRTNIRSLFFVKPIQKKLIYNEYAQQIEKIRRHGLSISHLDTHHQLHDMPGILNIMLTLMKHYNIPKIRILNNLDNTSFIKNNFRAIINTYLKSKRVHFSDFFGSRIEYLIALHKNPNFAKNKTVEIMVHPDMNSSGMPMDFIQKREYDFSFLNVPLSS